MTTLKYLSLTKPQRFVTNVGSFFMNFGKGVVNFFKGIPHRLYMLGRKLSKPFEVLWDAWKKGNWMVRTNFLVFGFYQLLHKEVARGVLYLLYEIVFIWFMFAVGGSYLGKLGSLGTFGRDSTYLFDVGQGAHSNIPGDESFFILLYSLVTFFFIGLFIVLWYFSIRDARSLQNSYAVGKRSENGQFFRDLLDSKYHTLLLAVPMVGLVAFTVIPIVFMIIVGFTNYSNKQLFLFDWVGLANYQNFFAGTGNASSGLGLVQIFLRVLAWTLVWALIATFTNYFLGMAVALLINKKGIKLKKLWRTVLILTIAVPQFVSLLLIQQMFNVGGFFNDLFVKFGWIDLNDTPFAYTKYTMLSRIIIIVVNMWVGVPYTMLISSGLLMNIPEDLYESARIDGATPFKMFSAITLPYMLFITGPYLLSQFIGNINNFNIIYLLTQGYPQMANVDTAAYGKVGETDILITWIYKMSMDGATKNYATACVLGVIVFVIIAFFSLIFYSRSNSVKNEGDFQ